MIIFSRHHSSVLFNLNAPYQRGCVFAFGFLLCMPFLLLQGCATPSTVSNQDQTTSADQKDQLFAEAQKHYLAQDYQEAIVLLKRLARDGDSRAQYALGYMLYYGIDYSQDQVTALKWIRLAAANGNLKAQQALKRHQILREDPEEAKADAVPPPLLVPNLQGGDVDLGSDLLAKPRAPKVAPIDQSLASPNKTKTATASKSKKEVSTENDLPDAQSDHLPGHAWLLARPSEHYTIQLVSTANEPAVKKFIVDHSLVGKAVYFTHGVRGRSFYSLIFGDYPDINAAKQELNEISPELKRMKPWVRSFGSIQRLLQ